MLRSGVGGAACALIASAVFVAGARAGESRKLQRSFDAGDRREIRLALSFGELQIEPGRDDVVHVEVQARCKHDWGRCRNHLDDLDLEEETHGDQAEIRLTGISKRCNSGMEVRMIVQVPASRDLEVRMGAGDLRIDGLERDLRVHLGAGDVDIRLPEEALRSVYLKVGVGDVTLRSSRGRAEPRRSHLIGGEVHWDRGPGEAAVDVRLGAGDVNVRLD